MSNRLADSRAYRQPQAARQLGVSRRTLTRSITAGRVKAYSIAGDKRRYVDMDELRRLRELKPIEPPKREGARLEGREEGRAPGMATTMGSQTRMQTCLHPAEDMFGTCSNAWTVVS